MVRICRTYRTCKVHNIAGHEFTKAVITRNFQHFSWGEKKERNGERDENLAGNNFVRLSHSFPGVQVGGAIIIPNRFSISSEPVPPPSQGIHHTIITVSLPRSRARYEPKNRTNGQPSERVSNYRQRIFAD